VSHYRVWSERPVADKYHALFDGVAEVINPGPIDDPLSTLPGSHAILASARIKYNGAFMDQYPTLRVIARTGIGIDNISLPDATAHKIMICNTPDAPTISTAEHAIALIFAVTKHIKRAEPPLRDGKKHDFFSEHNGMELDGRTLGLVGLGRIGSRVARVMQAVGMQVVVYDPYVSPERAAALGVTLLPNLADVLCNADVVSIHAPLTPDTQKLINDQTLALMKPGSYLVNSARGGLVDEAALLRALEAERLNGVGLDVFDPEPPKPDNPLLYRDDVICTPHVAGATIAGKDRLIRTAIEQILMALRGECPTYLCNPEVWERIAAEQPRS